VLLLPAWVCMSIRLPMFSSLVNVYAIVCHHTYTCTRVDARIPTGYSHGIGL